MSEIILHPSMSLQVFAGGTLPFISSTLHTELLVENFTGALIFLPYRTIYKIFHCS
jgi:hypothetical protein